MLQQIRDRTSGIIAGSIVALLVIPFAFFGIETLNTGGGDPVVAKVGSQKILQSQFQNTYNQRYQQFIGLMGENFSAEQFDQARFRQMVLDDMTQESMLRQYAEDSGYRANDAIVFQYLSRVPAFQKDGKFDTETYKAALARQGLGIDKFEAQVRTSIAIDQMRESMLETAFVTDADAQQTWRLANHERVISYALFDLGRYLPQVSVTDEQLKARYDERKAQLMEPERVRLAYVELSPESMAKAAAPDQDVLRAIYDAEKEARYTTQEERRPSHILINYGADKDAAKQKIEGIAAQLKTGKSFAELAKANSDDTGSKDSGGDLGWNKRGQMPESFEKVLYSLDKGEVSAPVETEFGWHLIKLDDLKPVVVRPFESAEVQKELADLYQNRELQKRFQEQSEKLEQLAFETPGSLDAVARELGLTVQTTDWFTRAGGAGIAANEGIKQVAFSPEVLVDGENSKPVTVGESAIVVVRKAEHQPARQKPLAEVAEGLREELRKEAASAAASADAAKLLAELRAGKPLDEAATAASAVLHSPGAIKRNIAGQDRALVQAAFKLPRPAEGKSRYGEVKLSDGNVAVVALTAIQEPAPIEGAELEQLRKQLRELRAGSEFSAYQKLIAEKVEVEIVNPPTAEAVNPEL